MAKPPPWWRGPLAQWCDEIGDMLDADTAKCLREWQQQAAVIRSLGQLLNNKNLSPLSAEHRRVLSRHPGFRRHLPPSLARLKLDGDLRPRRSKRRRDNSLDLLTVEQRRRVCAAGYLLLAAALAFSAASAKLEQQWDRAKLTVMLILPVSRWLYGHHRVIRPVIRLVSLLSGEDFPASSVYNLLKL
jgi:hypothetical protein